MRKEDLVYRLLKRAEICRQIPGRKSVQEGSPDRIADLLEEEAANNINALTDALDAAILALDDWTNTYSPELCDENSVVETKN